MHPETTARPVHMGLGDAIRRLTAVEWASRMSGMTPELTAERDMLLEALNVVPVVVGFDCDWDNIPDIGVGLFKHAATTSCCRIQPAVSDRMPIPPPSSEPSEMYHAEDQQNPVADKEGTKLRGTIKPRKRTLAGLFGSKE